MAVALKGVDKFYIAKVIKDDVDGIEYDVPKQLVAIQHVTREDAEESAKVYGDNKVQIVVKGEGTQTATFTTFALKPKELAELLGHEVVGDAMVSTNRAEDVTFGIMYRLKRTDGSYTYVALAKGKFLAPSEDVETENDGTDVTMLELSVELLSSVYEFEVNGKKASYKYLQLQEEEGKDYSTTFFAEMQTPDTLATIQGLTVGD